MTSIAPYDALVLCGGLGTRLRAALAGGQKTMAEVHGQPFLRIVLDWLREQGVTRAILCVGHRADEVEAYFAGAYPDLELVFSREKTPLGTAGALKNAEPLLRGRAALTLNGDSFCPVDLEAFARWHRGSGFAASLVAVPAGERRDGGCVLADQAGRVSRFLEKAHADGGTLNAGVYILEPQAFDAIPAAPCSLERDVLPGLVPAGVGAYRCAAPVFDIGTPERLDAFRAVYAAGSLTR